MGAVIDIVQPGKLQIVQLLVKPRKRQSGMLVAQGQGVVVVLNLLQIGAQVNGRIVVRGPEIEVTDKNLSPKGRGQQQCRHGPFAARSMAEPRSKAAGPQHHDRDADAAERSETDSQPRFGPDAKAPKPDERGRQHSAKPVGTGGLTARRTGGYKGKGRSQRQC